VKKIRRLFDFYSRYYPQPVKILPFSLDRTLKSFTKPRNYLVIPYGFYGFFLFIMTAFLFNFSILGFLILLQGGLYIVSYFIN